MCLLTVGKQGLKFEPSDRHRDRRKEERGKARRLLLPARSRWRKFTENLNRSSQNRGAMMQAAGVAQNDSQRDIDLPVLDQTGFEWRLRHRLGVENASHDGQRRSAELAPARSQFPVPRPPRRSSRLWRRWA